MAEAKQVKCKVVGRRQFVHRGSAYYAGQEVTVSEGLAGAMAKQGILEIVGDATPRSAPPKDTSEKPSKKGKKGSANRAGGGSSIDDLVGESPSED